MATLYNSHNGLCLATVDKNVAKTIPAVEREPNDYRDTAAFKAYVRQITAVIKKGRGVTVRQIKEALGDGYRVEWTADALEHLSDHLDTSFTIPTRYFWTDRPVRTIETTWNTRGDKPRKQARGQKARGRGFTL